MRPSLLVLSVLLHGTAIGAVIGLGAHVGEVGAQPPARIEIETTQAAVPVPPPVALPPVEAVQVESEPDESEVVVFDEVAPGRQPPGHAEREPLVDRLPDLPLVRVRPSPQAAEPPVEVAEPPPRDEPKDALTEASAPSLPPQEYVEAQRADNAPPRYPERERRLRHEGEVVLAVSVTADGEVAAVAVRRPSRYDAFNREAVRAARSWRFVPAREQGQQVASVTEIVVEFRLDDA